MRKVIPVIFYVALGLFYFFDVHVLHADYEQELRNQVNQVQRRYPGDLDLNYFHDMGIIARKSDEAGLNALTTEIVGSLLLKKMDDYVENQLDLIDRFFKSDANTASRMLLDLNRQDSYYQPTAEYLSTTGGQALSSELATERQVSVEKLQGACSFRGIQSALQALRKTGLMMTNRTEEIKSSRELMNALECCLNWKSKIDYYYETEFENDYDSGTIIEEGHLKIQTTPRDYTRAKWVGEWIYKFTGREGKAQGVSRATLVYNKGIQPAELTITSGKVNSVGRINFPISVAGDFRYLEMEGHSVFPTAYMPGQHSLYFVGCKEPYEE